jgi:hypothetical protein
MAGPALGLSVLVPIDPRFSSNTFKHPQQLTRKLSLETVVTVSTRAYLFTHKT